MQLSTLSSRQMTAAVVAVTGLLMVGPGEARGAVVFYTTRSLFNNAEPGLPVEGFSKAQINSAAILLQTAPLSGATNDGIFSTGSILPGISISNSDPLNTPGLIVYGNGAIFGGTKSVGTNWFGDALVLTFAKGVSAVAADVFAATSPGQTLAGDFTEDVFEGSTLLGSTTFSEAKGAFGFMGVSSTSPITSVSLLYTTDDATTFADNIAFSGTSAGGTGTGTGGSGGTSSGGTGSGGTGPASAVPEPSSFALWVCCSPLLGLFAGAARKAQISTLQPVGSAAMRTD